MSEKHNPMKSAEMSAEQNCNMINGVLDNVCPPLPAPQEKPLDKVKEYPPRKRSREREER